MRRRPAVAHLDFPAALRLIGEPLQLLSVEIRRIAIVLLEIERFVHDDGESDAVHRYSRAAEHFADGDGCETRHLILDEVDEFGAESHALSGSLDSRLELHGFTAAAGRGLVGIVENESRL